MSRVRRVQCNTGFTGSRRHLNSHGSQSHGTQNRHSTGAPGKLSAPADLEAALRKMMRIDVPAHLAEVGTLVMEGWRRLGERHRLPVTLSGRPASCSLNFDHPEQSALLTLLTARMRERGFLAGGTCSLTLAHTPHHTQRYLDALDLVFAELSDAITAGDVTGRLAGPVKHSTFTRLVD